MQLRPFQSEAVAAVLAALSRNPLLVAPTGSGKTVMGSAIAAGRRVLWLAHREELIAQAARALGGAVGIIKSGYQYTPLAPIQVASVATLVRREIVKPDLIVIDEAHRAAADSYQSVIARCPGVPRLGLTATPFRLDGRGLGELFGEIIVAATVQELCDAGYLHAPRVYASRSPDLRGVKVSAGDYNLKALAERVNTGVANADIVKTWQARAGNARTVAFAVDIEHSRAIVGAFQDAGIAAEHLDGGSADRAEILARLASGETRIVSNCMVLTEGYDLPALECAIIARPTASLCLHLQMIGRIMRACDGKAGSVVLDHAGNAHMHGLVTRRLSYSLDGSKKVGMDDALGLRRCPACGLFYDGDACPECGCVIEPGERKRPVTHGDGVLDEFKEDFEYRRECWNLIVAQRESMGYKPGWEFFRYRDRFGVEPVVGVEGELIDVQNAGMNEKRSVYERLLNFARSRGMKDGWASYRYRDIFGVWPTGFVSELKAADRLSELLKR